MFEYVIVFGAVLSLALVAAATVRGRVGRSVDRIGVNAVGGATVWVDANVDHRSSAWRYVVKPRDALEGKS